MTNTDIADDDVYWGQTQTHQQRQRMRERDSQQQLNFLGTKRIVLTMMSEARKSGQSKMTTTAKNSITIYMVCGGVSVCVKKQYIGNKK